VNAEKIKTIIRNDSRFSLIGVLIDGIQPVSVAQRGEPSIIVEEDLDDLGRVILNGASDCSRFEQYDETCKLMDEYNILKSGWVFRTCNLLIREGSEWGENVEMLKNYFWFRTRGQLDMYDYGSFSEKEINSLKESKRDKFFIHYNGHERIHRLELIDEIFRRGLEENGLISMLVPIPRRSRYPYAREFFDSCPVYLDVGTKNDKFVSINGYKHKGLRPDNPSFSFPFKHLQETFFQISAETYFYEKDMLFITEKTYKFIPYHPTIVLGHTGTLKKVREQGFKTFPDMFDESYDEIEDDKERMTMVVDEIEKFCKLDYDTKMDKYLKSFDNILHNQNLFFVV